MPSYFNYGQPRFRLVDARLAERIILLPMCNSEGEPEEYENEGVIYHKTIKGVIVPVNTIGSENVCRIKWTLKYNRFIKGSDCIELQKVLNHNAQLPLNAINKMHLKPYYDTLNPADAAEYSVFFSSKNFSIDILKGVRSADGMYISDLEFTTTELYPVNWKLAGIPASGYGGEHKLPFTGELET